MQVLADQVVGVLVFRRAGNLHVIRVLKKPSTSSDQRFVVGGEGNTPWGASKDLPESNKFSSFVYIRRSTGEKLGSIATAVLLMTFIFQHAGVVSTPCDHEEESIRDKDSNRCFFS